MTWATSPAATELEQVVLDWLAELLGLPAGLHGHIEDTASTSTLAALAAARAERPGRRGDRVRAGALLGREGGADPRPRAADGAGRRRVPDAGRLPARGRDGGRRDGRDDVDHLGRSRSRSSPTGARRRASGFTSTPPMPARRRCAPSSAGASRGRPRRLDRRQPAQVAVHAGRLLDALDAQAGVVPQGVRGQRRLHGPHRGRDRHPRLRAGARAAVPRAQALGGAPLLRRRGATGADPGARPPRRALRGVGARRARAGSSRRRGTSRPSASGTRAPTTTRSRGARPSRAGSSSRRRGCGAGA